jgi:hypothetical protein
MKKPLLILFALILIPGTMVLAQDNGDHHGGGNGGGWGNSGSGGGPQPKKRNRPQGQKNHKNPGRSHGGGSFNSSANRHFNSNNGQANNHGSNAAAGNNAPHHFGQTAQVGHGGNFGRPARVPTNLQRMGVKQIPPTLDRGHLLTADPQHSSMVQPQLGPRGQSLHAAIIAPSSTNAVVIQNHMTVINHSPEVMAQINIYNNHETVAGQYYWHSWNGTNYCHYYDSWGYHWYGWYWGNTCFWSRWYGNNWWWYDPGYARWCYWNNGFWWWQDPYANVVYVYNNGQYSSTADAAPAAGESPASTGPSTEVDFKSGDGSRMVKIVGNDAFLYDMADAANNKPFYLAEGVKDVKFSKTDNGQPLQILLTFNDGTSQTFDADGNPVNNSGSNAPAN